eukprot:s66_g32.t1
MAATNLRASTPCEVAASDASNWGEAGVVAKIPSSVDKELMRHCLRKSVWSKLLSPAQALLRSHGILPEEEELSEEGECLKTNAVWSVLARCLGYKLNFLPCQARKSPYQYWRAERYPEDREAACFASSCC